MIYLSYHAAMKYRQPGDKIVRAVSDDGYYMGSDGSVHVADKGYMLYRPVILPTPDAWPEFGDAGDE